MLGMWDVGDAVCSGCGMSRMWDVRDVGCSVYVIFEMWDVGDVGCCGREMSGMWDVRDVGCLLECGTLIYKIPIFQTIRPFHPKHCRL